MTISDAESDEGEQMNKMYNVEMVCNHYKLLCQSD